MDFWRPDIGIHITELAECGHVNLMGHGRERIVFLKRGENPQLVKRICRLSLINNSPFSSYSHPNLYSCALGSFDGLPDWFRPHSLLHV